MTFFSWLLGRKRTAFGNPANDPDLLQVVADCRQDAIKAAEYKLERSLTEAERLGIEGINSLLMLESCCQAFASPLTDKATVLADLEYFCKQSSQA
jgi:hypothetical protein